MAIELGETRTGLRAARDRREPSTRSPRTAPATLVYWTCNHCPYALAWHERMLDVARDYAERGVRFLAINSNDAERYPADSFEAMAERVERGGRLAAPLSPRREPGGGARLGGREDAAPVRPRRASCGSATAGAPDADYDDPSQGAAWVRAALDAVLGGREPEPAETPPVGCGVKWRAEGAGVTARRRLVRVPASSANLGPGYDVLAAALSLHLELEVEETGAFSVEAEGLDVPLDRSNLCVRAFESLHPADGIAFRIRSEIPLAAGLGSSAAAIVAGLLAADHLYELALEPEDVLAHAAEIEGHPDNVAAALYGGFVICGRRARAPRARPGSTRPRASRRSW